MAPRRQRDRKRRRGESAPQVRRQSFRTTRRGEALWGRHREKTTAPRGPVPWLAAEQNEIPMASGETLQCAATDEVHTCRHRNHTERRHHEMRCVSGAAEPGVEDRQSPTGKWRDEQAGNSGEDLSVVHRIKIGGPSGSGENGKPAPEPATPIYFMTSSKKKGRTTLVREAARRAMAS
jgi:hypothetical protein